MIMQCGIGPTEIFHFRGERGQSFPRQLRSSCRHETKNEELNSKKKELKTRLFFDIISNVKEYLR